MIKTLEHIFRITLGYFVSTCVASHLILIMLSLRLAGNVSIAFRDTLDWAVFAWLVVSIVLSIPVMAFVGLCERFQVQRWPPYAAAGGLIGGTLTPVVFHGVKGNFLGHLLLVGGGALIGLASGYVFWACAGHLASGKTKPGMTAVAVLMTAAITATYFAFQKMH